MSNGPVINIILNANTANATQGIEQFIGKVNGAFGGLQSMLEGVAKKLTAAISVGALVKLTKTALESAASMAELSEKIGMTVESLSTLTAVAKSKEILPEEFQVGIRNMAKSAIEAASGLGNLAPKLSALGVSVMASATQLKTPTQLLYDLSDVFQKMPNGLQKTALAAEIFGKSGENWIPLLNEGSEGIKKLEQAMRDAGKEMSTDFAEKAHDLEKTINSLKSSLSVIGLKLGKELVDALLAAAEGLKSFTQSVIGGGGFDDVIKGLAASVKVLITGLFTIEAALEKIGIRIAAQASFWPNLFQYGYKAAEDARKKLLVGLDVVDRRLEETVMKIWNPQIQESPEDKKKSDELINIEQLKKNASEAEKILNDFDAEIRKKVAGQDKDAQLATWNASWAQKINSQVPDMSVPGGKRFLFTDEQRLKMLSELEAARSKASQDITDKAMEDAQKKFDEAEQKAIEGLDRLNTEYAQATGSRAQLIEAQYQKEVAAIEKTFRFEQDKLDARNLLDKIYAQKRINLSRETQMAIAQDRINSLEGQIGLVQSNQDTTAAQKKALLLDIYGKENAALQQQMDINRDIAATSESADVKREAEAKLTEEKIRQLQIQQQINDLNSDSFYGRLHRNIVQLTNEWGNMAVKMADVMTNTVTGAVQGVSNALANVITGTQSAGAAFRQLAINMVTSFIANVLSMILMAKVAIPILTALGVLSGGSIPAAGTVLTLASLGTAMAATAAYADGGHVTSGTGPRSDDVLARLSRGEYVIPAASVQLYGLDFMEALRRRMIDVRDIAGAIPRGLASPISRGAYADGGMVSGGTSGDSVNNINIPIAVVKNHQEFREFIEKFGIPMVVDYLKKNPHKIRLKA